MDKFTDAEVAAMRGRLASRQQERRKIADTDAILEIVNRPRPETVGIIVPIEEAREFCEFRASRKMRGNWQETALMAVISAAMLVVSFLFLVR